ncbi:hypothetical protein LINPERPRIM_LOCUS40997 [Linum perenne]
MPTVVGRHTSTQSY